VTVAASDADAAGPVSDGGRPVEFWSTAAIRAALEDGDISVVAIKRDPFGRTSRQVEEILETRADAGEPHGIAKAMREVLNRSRTHLETAERAEVARHVRVLLDRSGLSQREFASRIGTQSTVFADYLTGAVCPPASLMIRMRRLSDRFARMRAQRETPTED
jgi:DNA-binding transcriptional regulator YiaG